MHLPEMQYAHSDPTLQVDFLIVLVSVLVLVMQPFVASIQALMGLRALRALKPLRMLTRSAGMRLVFKSLMLSMAAMANVSFVCLLFFLIFALLGTQLFMGLFWRCVGPSMGAAATRFGLSRP